MNEKTKYPYIVVINGEVHILVPICNGETVALDNTCQSAQALKAFIRDILPSINQYINDLESDIHVLLKDASQNALLKQKQHRLGQLLKYRQIILLVLQDPEIDTVRTDVHPKLPTAIRAQFKNIENNTVSILLAPKHEDGYIRFAPHLCSFTRAKEQQTERLQKCLTTDIIMRTLPNTCGSKDQLIQSALTALGYTDHNINVGLNKQQAINAFIKIQQQLNVRLKDLDPNINLEL